MSEHSHTFEVTVLPESIKVWRDTFGKIHLELDRDTAYNNVKPVPSFPLSSPDTCVSFEDSEGKEIGIVESLKRLDGASRKVVEEELELEYFVTQVLAIKDVNSRHGVTTWEFETERGPRTVHVKERSDIRALPNGRVVFTDVHGMHYEVKKATSLSDKSQGLLESEM